MAMKSLVQRVLPKPLKRAARQLERSWPRDNEPDFEGKRRFLVVFEGRSGSSLLVNLLNNHAATLCFPEILAQLPDQDEKTALIETFFGSGQVWNVNPYTLAGHYYPGDPWKKVNSPRIEAIGMKTKFLDIGEPGPVRRRLEAEDCPLIYLTRRNQLKAAVSQLRARQLNIEHGGWNARDETMIVPPIRIDPKRLQEVVRRRRQVQKKTRGWITRCAVSQKLTLNYEDLLATPYATSQRVLDLLGLPVSRLADDINLVKNTSDDLRQSILNFDEIRQSLKRPMDLQQLLEGTPEA
jgi:LPS sulfotransferase NodH